MPAGPINSIDEVSSDTCLQQRGLFYSVADGERVVPQIGLGIQVDGRPGMARAAPPPLGDDTEEILAGLRGAD